MEQHFFINALFILSLDVLILRGHSVIATTCNGTIITNEDRIEALQDLNNFRSELESGVVIGIDLQPYPTAEALYKLIFNALLKVGCSAQSCGGGIIATVACVYDNPFLKTGDPMYKVGEPCTVNENCSAYTPATCDTTTRLCQLDDTTTPAPITTSTLSIDSTTASAQSTTRGNLHPNPEINQICTDNAYMNDRIRMKALDMHNYRRSQIAKGEVAKFNGNKLPSAANMVKLNYDCTLETTAYAHASTCSNTYSSPSSRLGIEENIHSVSGQAVAYRVDAMGEAIKFWWKQIRLETVSIGMAVTFKRPHLNSQIRFFTMMAWATTTKLGCGVAKCRENFFVVCHYQPGGNVVDDTVYTIGTPCRPLPNWQLLQYTALCHCVKDFFV